MKRLLKSYLKRLTNLSAGNKSLMQLRLYQGQDLDVKNLEFLLKDQSAFQVIEKLIFSGAAFKIAQTVDSRDASNNEVSKVLKSIFRKNQLIFDERGVHDLYLAWPFVQGKMMDGGAVRCPLLFFSVTLEETNNHWILKRNASNPISFNRSFLLAYSYFNKVSFSDEFLETNFDDFPSDALEFRNELYKLLKESNLEINFNRDLFENEVKQFSTYKRQEVEAEFKLGELKLMPNAVLGIYPQAGSYLVPDYEKMILQTDDEKSMESFFMDKDVFSAKSGSGEFLHQKIKEEHTYTPFLIDASQENAIKAVKSGKSLVVQGPPGTGKSQLICNLVADYVASGKKVLVVCQKKVALEVVENRLKELALSDFSVLLHDFKNDRKAIFEQIAAQIHRLEDFERQNNQLDSVFLERNFLKSSREIDKLTEELTVFKYALFDTEVCGVSVKEMYLNSAPSEQFVDLSDYFTRFKINEIGTFKRLISNVFPYYVKFDREEYSFKNRKSFAAYTASDKRVIKSLLEEFADFINEFYASTKNVLGVSLTIEQGLLLANDAFELKTKIQNLGDSKVYSIFMAILEHGIDHSFLNQSKNKLVECFRAGLEKSLKAIEIPSVVEALKKYNETKENVFSRLIFKVFSKEAKVLSDLLKQNNLTWKEGDIKQFSSKLNQRIIFEEQLKKLKKVSWAIDLPQDFELNSFLNWFENVETAMNAHELVSKHSFMQAVFTNSSFESAKENVFELIKSSDEIAKIHEQWSLYLAESQMQKLLKYLELLSEYVVAIENDFEDLCAYDQLLEALSEVDKLVLEKLFSAASVVDLEMIQHLFVNSIYLHWIDFIEQKYPILREVSSMEMEKRERIIREEVGLKRTYSVDIVLQKAREFTYKNVEYNRLNNRVSYRDLEHQVTKQRRLWPLRKIMNDFSKEVLDLIPCWLASPEAVSAVFPLDFQFDLVIFDEASQCYAEKGIPALYRSKQFVITGDSKQLSPYDLYQVRFEDEEEEEENPLLENDSLLDLASKFLMELNLKGHYRSRSVDLIQFSNQHFYKGNLKMLPAKNDFLSLEKGFDYHLVKGVWNNNINEIEAGKVVDLCLAHFEIFPEKTLGVVCFNYKQQHYIYDQVQKALLDKKAVLPNHFFVKNIENVQGDERDVIIFSLAYAPNKSGKLQMNFGSLNQKGGENRLNVAVTRAKEKNIIVASIMPQELEVENAKNNGPKLLKAFLEYAFNVSEGKFKVEFQGNDFRKVPWLLKNKITLDEQKTAKYTTISDAYFFADVLLANRSEAKVVLTDDDLYYSSESVKEAHVYLPLALKNKEWEYRQDYSRNYWAKR